MLGVDTTVGDVLRQIVQHGNGDHGWLTNTRTFLIAPALRGHLHRDVAQRAQVNNWNLVDASAPALVGSHLLERPRTVLAQWARSSSLWDRRIAVVATLTSRSPSPGGAVRVQKALARWRGRHERVGPGVSTSTSTEFAVPSAAGSPGQRELGPGSVGAEVVTRAVSTCAGRTSKWCSTVK